MNAYRILVGKPEEKRPLEDQDVGGWIILSRVLVTETGFGLVIGFINRSQVVTTINYNTVTNCHSTSTPPQSSQSDFLFSPVFLVPIRALVRLLLPRLLFTRKCHCIHVSSSGTELVWN
jgi:hypothetical protein